MGSGDGKRGWEAGMGSGDGTVFLFVLFIKIYKKHICIFLYFYTPDGTRTHNPQIRSLVRYPIAPQGQIPGKGLEPLTTRLKV
tara:strand:- start:164 stop:412 length:249 start_codon:yes stop_codon:yes gene_type:complete